MIQEAGINDYTPVGRMTVVRIEYLAIFSIAWLTIIRRYQLLSFQDFSDFFEQMYDNDYPLAFVRQYFNQIIAVRYSFFLLIGTIWLDEKIIDLS